MIVFLNGRLVPEEQAVVSVFDRGFLYGDGLFEGVRIYNGHPFRWTQHLERFRAGADYLQLSLPFTPDELRAYAEQLIVQNRSPEGFVRLSLSRGVGPRGYSPRGADQPTLVMALHPAAPIDPQRPPQWSLFIASPRLPANERLATIKTSNKLPQIMAKAEAQAFGADEALLLNTDGHLAEAASSNLFWFEGTRVCTPPLATGILAGVTRAITLEICASLGWPVQEKIAGPATLLDASGVFLTVTTLEAVEAVRLDGKELHRSPQLEILRREYRRLVLAECGVATPA